MTDTDSKDESTRTTGTSGISGGGTVGREGAASLVRIEPLDADDARVLEHVAALALSLDVRNLSPEQRASGGFLTLPARFDAETARGMANRPSVVALDASGRTVGFMLTSAPDEDTPSLVVRALLATFSKSPHAHRSAATYGPMGIARSHQGQGLAPRMFSKLREAYDGMQVRTGVGTHAGVREQGNAGADRDTNPNAGTGARAKACEDVLIGFIDASNMPSIGLHTRKLGFEPIGRFQVANKDYLAIMFDLRGTRLATGAA